MLEICKKYLSQYFLSFFLSPYHNYDDLEDKHDVLSLTEHVHVRSNSRPSVAHLCD